MSASQELLDQASDAMLAQRIAANPSGTAQAEETELYRRFASRVRLYGLRHLRDETRAQDLVQDVLLVTIERLRAGEVRKPEEIGSFILGTSRMMAMSLRRTERRREALAAQFGHLRLSSEPEIPSVDHARVEACLRTLSDRDSTVLILSFYAERTASQVGEELGLSAGAVRVVRHRALERLRECVTGSTHA